MQQNRVRLGLWGASGSGKTTFMAALGIATAKRNSEQEPWTIFGSRGDTASSNWLIESTDMLWRRKQFPPPTLVGVIREFELQGRVQVVEEGNGISLGRFHWGASDTLIEEDMSFGLSFVDVPGEIFEPNSNLSEDDILDDFEGCQGLVFLYDPEAGKDNYNAFYPLVWALGSRLSGSGRMIRGKLPQHLAVCVSKFDQPDVFVPARKQIEMTYGAEPPHFPTPANPKEFFDLVTRDDRDLPKFMNQYFHADRINYYATSAVGFRTVNDVFNEGNFLNTRAGVNGGPAEIIGDPYPINVLEPLIDLADRIMDDFEGGS